MNTAMSQTSTARDEEAGASKPSPRSHHPSVCHVGPLNFSERSSVKSSLFLPWSKVYRFWWGCTIVLAFVTILFESYEIAFVPAGLGLSSPSTTFLYVVSAIFLVDILFTFNLAYEENDEVIRDRRQIAQRYVRGMLWLDIVGVVPFYPLLLAITGTWGENSRTTQYLALVRLLTLVRLHRVVALFQKLQYSTKISLMTLTLLRNFLGAFIWTHLVACLMFFTSRLFDHSENTWIGGSLDGMEPAEVYITALYWSVVTFTTVGYGDFSPRNAAEQVVGMLYMLINIVIQAWIIGSITLLVVKSDENTGKYRDTLAVIDQYADINRFEKSFHKGLRAQLKLDFGNREVADEKVLANFPLAVRRKVLRNLYLKFLQATTLMSTVRGQFVDAFLTTCKVEIFRPMEEILQRGSIATDLFLLVGGEIELLSPECSVHGTRGSEHSIDGKLLGPGDFINDVEFLTESPQIHTARTTTVCKTLTLSRHAYRMLAEDHPGSAGKILQNLLGKVETTVVNMPAKMEELKAGSVYLLDKDTSETASRSRSYLANVRDLIEMHICKQKDDHTTRFLFSASRGDTKTIALMCDQGFDPDSADYDSRTALMVSAMTGNNEVVSMLLNFGAKPNLADMHGSTALYEAVKNGHITTMKTLLDRGASLCMSESLAASTLCQTVFEGDIQCLRRLLQAGIQVNAADYDKRTAAHIAAAEGNQAALHVLVEFGADLELSDRWNNTAKDEAKKKGLAKVE